MKVLCVLAQRNEVACLEPWVRYHSYMVGIENIHIIDNASDMPEVVEKIAEYERLGIHVTRIPPNTDLALRGSYTAQVIQEIEADNSYDFVFPMDCDEFLCVLDPAGNPSCDRRLIFNYLRGLSSQEGVFRIKAGLENINKVQERFIWRDHYVKVFFSGRQCLNLDIGYHVGFPKNGAPVIHTDIFYLHMQVRPYNMFRYLARQKLAPFVDPDDCEALKVHEGANHHLTHLYLKTEEEYDQFLEEKRQAEQVCEVEFTKFTNTLRIIGVNPQFLDNSAYIIK
ncbi:glycosyltransferase family 2 protein [Methylobacterium indicum]|uniref:glycosyltransferase family 2 protein n=1 Tax=Methylobacterium indicum TaxID=1775910 RepID=UPI0009E4D19C|nr:glycosyltransferase family 2 protein [Methylobacterium indicum]